MSPHEIRDKFKRLTNQELDKLFPDWKTIQNSEATSLLELKPIIVKFDDFEENTKKIYLKIKEFLLIKNKHQNGLKVWAVGSRINGRWRTKEESELWAKLTDTEVRYSDYDFITNALIVPNCNDMYGNDEKKKQAYKEMYKFVGARVDLAIKSFNFKTNSDIKYIEVP